MKIAFIGGRDFRMAGGIENYMYNLSTKLASRGHDITVFCESDSNRKEFVDGVNVVYHKSPKSRFLCKPLLGLKSTLYTICYLRGTDIIHYNAWAPAIWIPIARLFGKTCVMEGHGLEWMQTKYSPKQKRILKLFEHLTAWWTPNLVMCSDAQTEYFKSKYNYKATTIPGGVNLPLNESGDDSILERFGIVKKKYYLLMARLTPVKNTHFLIEAFNNAKLKDYQLVIAGDNSTEPDYINQLKEMARENKHIIFTGNLSGTDKDSILRNAYIFCIPSTSEGLPIALLEAMSYKIPIIASTIPANKEVLNNGHALWVRPESVSDLEKALKDGIYFGNSVQQYVDDNFEIIKKNYTWDKITKRYEEYLALIINS